MRKTRDYDAELKALGDKAKSIKAKKVQQLGELVIATGADAIGLEALAGALLTIAEDIDNAREEAWEAKGSAFFQGRGRKAGKRTSVIGQGAGETPADNSQG